MSLFFLDIMPAIASSTAAIASAASARPTQTRFSNLGQTTNGRFADLGFPENKSPVQAASRFSLSRSALQSTPLD